MHTKIQSTIKFIRWIQVILIVVLIFVAYSMILPEEARLERSIEINTGPEVIFNHFNDLELFSYWSPWYDTSDGASYTLSNPAYGVGATMQWGDIDKSGGRVEIITSVPYKIVSSQLDITTIHSGISTITIYNNRENTRCFIVWSFDAKLEGVIQRYAGRFLDRLLGPDFERGLAKLKGIAESGAPQPN